MVTAIQWIPFRELVLETEREIMPFSPAVERPPRPSEAAPLVMVTPDRHVIAGRAYLRAGEIDEQDLILCRVVQPDDLDITLTILHNEFLYRQLDTEELSQHLDLYAEVCRHLQLRAALQERQRPPATEDPDAGDGSL